MKGSAFQDEGQGQIGRFILNPPIKTNKSHPVFPLHTRLRGHLGGLLESDREELDYTTILLNNTLCLNALDETMEIKKCLHTSNIIKFTSADDI